MPSLNIVEDGRRALVLLRSEVSECVDSSRVALLFLRSALEVRLGKCGESRRKRGSGNGNSYVKSEKIVLKILNLKRKPGSVE